MAVKLLVLLNLILLIRDVTSLCNVICTTDYATSLNCSCSGKMPISPIQVEAKCTDLEDEFVGDCEIKPPYGWCLIEPDIFSEFTSIGTICRAKVSQTSSQHKMKANDTILWKLEDMVKLQPPFNLQVKNNSGDFNITWDVQSIDDDAILKFEIRISPKKYFSKGPVYYSVEDKTYITIYHASLQPFTEYGVDIRTTLSTMSIYKGPWSEWSSKIEWRTGPWGETTMNHNISMLEWHFFLPVVLVFSFLVSCYIYIRKPILFRSWFKKLKLIRYIPSPDDFFKPLYHTHNGNFKDWVRPVFSECDFLVLNTPFQLIDHKGQDIFNWKRQTDNSNEDNEWTRKQGSHCQPSSSSLLYFQEGSGHVNGDSSGHISIHTVLLSKEEDIARGSNETWGGIVCGGNGERAESEKKESYQIGEKCGLLAKGGKQSDVDWQTHGHNIESERISLDSFNSNEQSEDGYPHVDLDTIDSGFGESDCSSPLNSEFNGEDQIDASVFTGEGSSSSNYVKQWMICKIAQGDATN